MSYTTEEVEEIWSDLYTLDLWASIECAALKAQTEIGQIPEWWWKRASAARVPKVEAWREETALNGHEFVAFLNLWAENGAEHVHIGLTSSDVTDTALAIKLADSGHLLADALTKLVGDIYMLDEEMGTAARLGRTHGQPAVATTYSTLFDRWRHALVQTHAELLRATNNVAIGKISGPIGTWLHVDPYVEQYVCDQFELGRARAATQITPRYPLAQFVAQLGIVATIIESIALELRLLSHAQVGEVTDGAGSTSSAMPHKTNPNRLERLTGLARIVRSAYDPITEGIVQWHERDMAHSSVEKTLLPQSIGIVHYMCQSLSTILQELRFSPIRALHNLADYHTEVQTHSMQTHLQLKGHSYVEAKAEISRLLRENIGAGALRVALNRHPDLKDYRPPNTTRKEHLDGTI